MPFEIILDQLVRNLLEIAILKILHEETLHGYAIVQKLSFIFDKEITPNVVYPALYKLENNKLIQSKAVQRGKRQIIKVYSLTDRGKEIFQKISEMTKKIIL